jgi:putative protease
MAIKSIKSIKSKKIINSKKSKTLKSEKNLKIKKPELLSGVGNFASAIAAVENGADAVYFGIQGFNMRDLGKNFSIPEAKKLIKYLHSKKVKAYLAINTIIFDEEIKQTEKIIKEMQKAKIDAFIVSDMGVLELCKKHNATFFVSTQASAANSLATQHYKKIGATRVIMAREISLKQLKEVCTNAKKINLGIECFVHGAMCISISGRCFLSHELFGKSANRGECLQPCRRAYFLDGDAPNYEKKEVYLDGSTILSAKDMKTIEFLDKIIETGVESLKIEGRTKPVDYIATTTKCYREAIDSIFEKTYTKEKIEDWNNRLSGVYNRGFSTGFFFGTPDKKDLADKQGSYQKQKRRNIGKIINYFSKIGVIEVRAFDSFKLNDEIIIEGPNTFIQQKIESIEVNRTPINKVEKGMIVGIKVKDKCKQNDLLYVIEKR